MIYKVSKDSSFLEQIQHEILEAPIKVYNFEVADFHTYYVGESSVLVHNTCGQDGFKDIYRAVSPDEFSNIITTNSFRGGKGSLEAKGFGNSFSETLDFANRSINREKAAIVKVTIPHNIYDQVKHINLDRNIFKSGTPIVNLICFGFHFLKQRLFSPIITSIGLKLGRYGGKNITLSLMIILFGIAIVLWDQLAT